MTDHQQARHHAVVKKIKMEAMEREIEARLNTSIRVIKQGKKLVYIGDCEHCECKFQIEGRHMTKPEENRTKCVNCGRMLEVKLFNL